MFSEHDFTVDMITGEWLLSSTTGCTIRQHDQVTLGDVLFCFYRQGSGQRNSEKVICLICDCCADVVMIHSFSQKTSTCCLQTENQEKRQRVWWGNKWNMLQTKVWRELAWSYTRSQPSPQYTTSNMMMTFISMSMTWSKPPRDTEHLPSLSPAFFHLLLIHLLSVI